jgi:hypothetical protein
VFALQQFDALYAQREQTLRDIKVQYSQANKSLSTKELRREWELNDPAQRAAALPEVLLNISISNFRRALAQRA